MAFIAGVKATADLVVNARIDVHIRGGATDDALLRARCYRDAGADSLYPIGITDEDTIARFVELGTPVNILLRPGAPSIERLAASASRASASATTCTPRCSTRCSGGSAASVGVRDRHPPVAAERARRDLDPGRRLAALVLGPVDQREHPLHGLLGSPASASWSRLASSSM